MTETVGGPVFTATYDVPQITECCCDCDCPELADSDEGLCIACKHRACPDDTE